MKWLYLLTFSILWVYAATKIARAEQGLRAQRALRGGWSGDDSSGGDSGSSGGDDGSSGGGDSFVKDNFFLKF